MKIYNRVVIKISTGEIVEEDSFEYEGPLTLCDGGGDGGGGGGDDDDWGTSNISTVSHSVSTAPAETYTYEGVYSAEGGAGVEFDTADAWDDAVGDGGDYTPIPASDIVISPTGDVVSAPAGDGGVDYMTLFEGGVIGQEQEPIAQEGLSGQEADDAWAAYQAQVEQDRIDMELAQAKRDAEINEAQAAANLAQMEEEAATTPGLNIFYADPLSQMSSIDALVEQPDIQPDYEKVTEGTQDPDLQRANQYEADRMAELGMTPVPAGDIAFTEEGDVVDMSGMSFEEGTDELRQRVADTKSLSPVKWATNLIMDQLTNPIDLDYIGELDAQAQLAAANEQYGSEDAVGGDGAVGINGKTLGTGTGDLSTVGGTDTDPATSGTTERRGDAPVEGEGETPEEVERKARQRQGFTQNLYTSVLGLGKADTRRRYLLRGGGRQRF
jgi:hypothetical protein